MGWKTVVINDKCKLSLELESLCIRQEEDWVKIPIKDIETVLLMYHNTVITVPILTKLIDKNVNVIISNEKNDPCGIFYPFNGHSYAFKRLNTQLNWEQGRKNSLWKMIVKEKILSEGKNIKNRYDFFDDSEFINLSKSVKLGDKDNREGFAARLYYQYYFNLRFKRFDNDFINSAINYGYKILASYISRFIASRGYLVQLGIKHKGESNAFNLTYDFIETFRIIVDRFVMQELYYKGKEELTMSDRIKLSNILNTKVVVKGNSMYLSNAIDIILDSYFNYLSKDKEEILTYDYEKIKFSEN